MSFDSADWGEDTAPLPPCPTISEMVEAPPVNFDDDNNTTYTIHARKDDTLAWQVQNARNTRAWQKAKTKMTSEQFPLWQDHQVPLPGPLEVEAAGGPIGRKKKGFGAKLKTLFCGCFGADE